MEDNIKMDLR